MNNGSLTFRNGVIFDGERLWNGHALRIEAGRVADFGPVDTIAEDGDSVDLAGDILSPGYVDLQINGGGGVMFNDDPSVDTLAKMAVAHRRLGVRAFLPTLISDTPKITARAVAAATEAVQAGMPGIAGLHLEGPHLSIARKGAHDPAHIRAMEAIDLDMLLEASRTLPVLKVTIAPEAVSEEQVKALVAEGILVSLGHTDADYGTCRRYVVAGATVATHLFNAMSQLGSRAPGLVGAALESDEISAGLIADGVHVHPANIRMSFAAKRPPGQIFLISDAMAVAGTDLKEFELGGRRVIRVDGSLKLADSTLAGADIDLTQAVRLLVSEVGLPLVAALQAATTVPGDLIGLTPADPTQVGAPVSQLIRISSDLSKVSSLV